VVLSHADKSIAGESAGVPSVSKRELRRRSGLAQRREMAWKAQVLQDASTGFPLGDERHHPHSRAATGTTQNFNCAPAPFSLALIRSVTAI